MKLKELLLKILTVIRAPVIIRTTTLPSTTYQPAGSTGVTTWVYDKNWHATAIAGYTPIGVLQATPNNSGQLICQVTLIHETYGDRFVGWVKNIYTSNVTDTIAVPVIYIRTELLGGGTS